MNDVLELVLVGFTSRGCHMNANRVLDELAETWALKYCVAFSTSEEVRLVAREVYEGRRGLCATRHPVVWDTTLSQGSRVAHPGQVDIAMLSTTSSTPPLGFPSTTAWW